MVIKSNVMGMSQGVFALIVTLLFILLVAVLLFFYCFCVVKDEEVMIVEKLGKYKTIKSSGKYFLLPIIESDAGRVKMKNNTIEKDFVLAKDGSTNIHFYLIYSIKDPANYFYNQTALKILLEYGLQEAINEKLDFNNIEKSKNGLLEEFISKNKTMSYINVDSFILNINK